MRLQKASLLLTVTILLLLPIGVWRATGVTFAGNTAGSFEIDGNLTVDHPVPPAEPIDWFSNPFPADRKSTRLNSSHPSISYAVICLKKKKRWRAPTAS